jgi:bacterioferritin-associated ferredoxin
MILIVVIEWQGTTMIVNISDREIRQAVELGITSMAELHEQLGVGTCCGKCVSYAREVLGEHLNTINATELRFQRQAA